MKNKNIKKLTFADRAREIMKKYEKFKDDPISLKSMERELDYLAQEQEEYKAQQGIGQENSQQPVQMWKGGNDPTKIDILPGSVDRNVQPELYVPDSTYYLRQGYQAGKNSVSKNDSEDKAKFNLMGAAGSAGNVFQLIDDLRNPAEVVQYDRVNPDLIDSTIQENNARNTINTSINNVIGQSNETSQTGGQRLARRAGLESIRTDKIGRALGAIRENTDAANSQISNQAKYYNNRLDVMEDEANAKNRAARKARIASNLNQIGSNFFSKPMAEKNQNQVVNNTNTRLLNALMEGVSPDYIWNMLLNAKPNNKEK